MNSSEQTKFIKELCDPKTGLTKDEIIETFDDFNKVNGIVFDLEHTLQKSADKDLMDKLFAPLNDAQKMDIVAQLRKKLKSKPHSK